MAETGGILHSILSMGPMSDINMAMEVYVDAYCRLRDIINSILFNDFLEKSQEKSREEIENDHESAVVAAAEIKHIVGIFKVFFDQWHLREQFRKNNFILTNLATIFCDEDDFRGEYNKVCYMIRQNLPTAVGEGQSVLKAPEPFKSQIFDD